MSLFSDFIEKHVIKILEKQFLSYLPELQTAFLNDISVCVKIISDWIETKLNSEGAQSNEEKTS